MKRIVLSAFTLLVLSSCVYYGTGIKTVSGTLSASAPLTVKIALFPPGRDSTFIYDYTNDSYGADKDVIYQNESGDITGEFSPVSGLTATISGSEYSITFPDDPATVKCLVAWDDLDGDGKLDLGAEAAYLPVKEIGSVDHVVHWFSYIEIVEEITYLAVFSTMDRDAADYNLNLYDPHQDNLDAIGAEGFYFNFR